MTGEIGAGVECLCGNFHIGSLRGVGKHWGVLSRVMIAADDVSTYRQVLRESRRAVANRVLESPETWLEIGRRNLLSRTAQWQRVCHDAWEILLETCDPVEISRILSDPNGSWEEALCETHPFDEG